MRVINFRVINFSEEVDDLPNIKSAEKRVKVIKAKTIRNQMIKSALKTSIKKFNAALEQDDKANREAAYKAAIKRIDQAAAKGIIHRNAAARKKSQLTLKQNAMQLQAE